MSNNLFVSEARANADRVLANCRRKLRRWLIKNVGMPKHSGVDLLLDMDLEALSAEVANAGGYPEEIITKAKAEAIDWIIEGR